MKSADYPYHEDLEWLGVDRDGLIARFTTGGLGPVPKVVLASWSQQQALQEAICRLTSESDAEVMTKIGNPQDFRLCAERGLFAYDWSDVHRTDAEALGSYELMARPTKPLAMASVLKLVRDAQEILPRFSVAFSESSVAPIGADIEWAHP
jgi:hypothetical protein